MWTWVIDISWFTMSSPLPRPFIPPHAMEADSPRLRARSARRPPRHRPGNPTKTPTKCPQQNGVNQTSWILVGVLFSWQPHNIIDIYIYIDRYIIVWQYYQGFRGMEICKEMIASNWKLFHAVILILLIAWWDSFQDSWSGRTICIMHHHSSSSASFIINDQSSIILHHHSSSTISHPSSFILNHQSSLWSFIHQPSVITMSLCIIIRHQSSHQSSLPPIATDHQPHEAEFMISTEMENSRSIRVNGLLIENTLLSLKENKDILWH